jgi:hypothetical protein
MKGHIYHFEFLEPTSKMDFTAKTPSPPRKAKSTRIQRIFSLFSFAAPGELGVLAVKMPLLLIFRQIFNHGKAVRAWWKK